MIRAMATTSITLGACVQLMNAGEVPYSSWLFEVVFLNDALGGGLNEK